VNILSPDHGLFHPSFPGSGEGGGNGASERQLRQKLPEAARRREIEVVRRAADSRLTTLNYNTRPTETILC